MTKRPMADDTHVTNSVSCLFLKFLFGCTQHSSGLVDFFYLIYEKYFISKQGCVFSSFFFFFFVCVFFLFTFINLPNSSGYTKQAYSFGLMLLQAKRLGFLVQMICSFLSILIKSRILWVCVWVGLFTFSKATKFPAS